MRKSHPTWTAAVATAILAFASSIAGAALPATAATTPATAAPAAATSTAAAPVTPSAGDILIPRTIPFGTYFASQSGLVPGTDGALWFTCGLNDIVRLAPDGTRTDFTAWSGPGPSWVGSSLLPDDDGGFTYSVSVGETAPRTPHLMHIALDGTTTEIALPSGVTDGYGATAGSDGTVWFAGQLNSDRTLPMDVVRVVHGVTQTSSVPGRVLTIVATPDGGAWVSTWTGLVRIAPDGTVSPVAGLTGRVSSLWAGSGSSAWIIRYSSGDQTYHAAQVQPDGTFADAVLGTGLQLVLPATLQAQRSETWIAAVRPDQTQLVFAGTSPADLHPITVPMPWRQLVGTEVGGRLWVGDDSAAATPGGVERILSIGADGSVRDEAELPNAHAGIVGAGPDGTVWMVGKGLPDPTVTWAQVFALHPDGTLQRGVAVPGYTYRTAFDSTGRFLVETNSGIASFASATTDRLGGADRYAAAATIARAAYPSGAPVVFVASGQNFPDALSAGPLAASSGGALLLTASDALPDATRSAIADLNPQKIVVIGGIAAVSDTVLGQLRSLAPTVQRISGADRYVVSRSIVQADQQAGKPLFVATGTGFADASTAGAAAARAGGQLLLVPGGEDALPADYASFIQSLRPSSIAVVGGPAAVSNGIVAQLNTVAATTRYSGADRYGSSAAVLRAFGTPSTHVYLTTGSNFPDALAAAPLAGRADSTMVTVAGSCIPADTIAAIDAAQPSAITILGGPNAVTDDVGWLHPC